MWRSLSLLFAFVACNAVNDPGSKKADSLVQSVPELKDTAEMDTIVYKSPETKISFKKNQAIVKGAIAPGEKPAISFVIDTGRLLSIQLQPVSTGGNLRVSQIRFPDGKMDGPLGDSISYPLKQKGLYSILLGQNLMAGDPWSGDWILKLALK